jgi:CheY-like chemotaxis protein
MTDYAFETEVLSGLPRVVIADDDEAMAALLEVLVSVSGAGEVVAVAHDGREAVDLVLKHDPEIALLDIEMPRLRGTQAAAAIRTYRPQTRVILHTGNLDHSVRREAAALGVQLLDKLAAPDSLKSVLAGEIASANGEEAARPIEDIVLVALERRPNEAVIVIAASEEVVFYDHLASEILALPFPPKRMPFAEFRRSLTSVGSDGTPQPPEKRPMFRALAARADSEGVFYELVRDEILTMRSRAKAYHGPDGEFLGVAAYWTVLARRPATA